MAALKPKTAIEIAREIEDRELSRKEQEWKDLMDWVNMPAYVTQDDVEKALKKYGKRKAKTPLYIQFRAIIPFVDNPTSWRIWLEVVDKNGALFDGYKVQGSPAYIRNSVWRDKSWKEDVFSNSLSFYSKPLNNPVKEVVAPEKKEPKPKAVPKPKKTGFLIDDLDSGEESGSIPAWMDSPPIVRLRLHSKALYLTDMLNTL